MLRSYLTVALRALLRRRAYTLINLFGLTISLASAFLIGIYVRHELSFDRFHDGADRIVRLAEEYREDGRVLETSATVPFPVGPALRTAFDVEVARAYRPFQGRPLVAYEDRQFYEQRFFFVDSTFFDVFAFRLLRGDAATALDAPYSVVLTESAARKYFGDADPIDRVLRFENQLDLRVTGVVEDPPSNTHFQFDFLGSISPTGEIVATTGIPDLEEAWEGWFWNPVHTYLRLPPGMTPASLEQRLPGFVRSHFPEFMHESVAYYLQPLTSIHLHSDLTNEVVPNGRMRNVRFFAIIALFLLLIACINFTNLSTARSLQRAREVGMRKVLGARRGQLVGQFLGEALLLSAVAAVLAAALSLLLLPSFGQLLGATLPRALWFDPVVLLGLLGVTVFVGLLAGAYPAFVLSTYDPSRTLRGSLASSRETVRLRQGLVVAQFAISIVLVVSTFVVNRQLSYLQSKDLGFDREQIVIIPVAGSAAKEAVEPFKEELRRVSGVLDAAALSAIPGRGTQSHGFKFEGVDEPRSLAALFSDADFARTLGIEIVEGRGFDQARGSDREGCLLSASLAADLGWTGSAVGRRLESKRANRILGVFSDFHFAPLHEGIRPLIICYAPTFFDYVAVRVAPGEPEAVMRGLRGVWAAFVPDRPFEAFFLDDDLDALYRAEQRLEQGFGTFAGLAIFVACLGLLGLATYTTERRTKEIGIRKVLGASSSQVTLLLSRDLVTLVAVAFLVAAPVAYLAMSRWLDNFAYRIGLSWWIFLAAGLLALGIATLTVGSQTLRAALANPVRALRYE